MERMCACKNCCAHSLWPTLNLLSFFIFIFIDTATTSSKKIGFDRIYSLTFGSFHFISVDTRSECQELKFFARCFYGQKFSRKNIFNARSFVFYNKCIRVCVWMCILVSSKVIDLFGCCRTETGHLFIESSFSNISK